MLESASLEYFNNNSRCRAQLEEAIRTAFEAGAEWKANQIKRTNKRKTMKEATSTSWNI